MQTQETQPDIDTESSSKSTDGDAVAVRELPGGTRVLVDLDEGTDVVHVARGERGTVTACDHDLDGTGTQPADRETLAGARACPDCVRLRREGRA